MCHAFQRVIDDVQELDRLKPLSPRKRMGFTGEGDGIDDWPVD